MVSDTGLPEHVRHLTFHRLLALSSRFGTFLYRFLHLQYVVTCQVEQSLFLSFFRHGYPDLVLILAEEFLEKFFFFRFCFNKYLMRYLRPLAVILLDEFRQYLAVTVGLIGVYRECLSS